MPQHTEKQLTSKDIFEGKVIRVTLDTVTLENGKTAKREIVHHNGGAAIIALNEKGQVALVRQFRYALGKELIEIPAGKVEKGEDPRQTAIRELREETGFTADTFLDFGTVIPTCGYCTEVIHLFLATGLHSGRQQLDEDEFLDIFWEDLDTAAAKIMRGEIADSKTVAGILKAYALRQAGKI